jgi:hypothetical protein
VVVDHFPHGLDYAWLAVDAVGHVGIFTNAGQGPIPIAVLVDRITADSAEPWVKALPERAQCEMLITLPRPDDFIAFARRGLFPYDWRGVVYELIARPSSPVQIQELGSEIGRLAQRVEFNSLQFGKSLFIAVPQDVEY